MKKIIDKINKIARKGKNKMEKFECQCLNCGYVMSSSQHCNELTCPRCGGQMRRASRPGIGR